MNTTAIVGTVVHGMLFTATLTLGFILQFNEMVTASLLLNGSLGLLWLQHVRR